MNTQHQHKTIGWETLTGVLNRKPEERFIVLNMSTADHTLDRVMECSMALSDVVVAIVCHRGSVMAVVDGVSQVFSRGQMFVLFPEIYCNFGSLSTDFEARAIFMHVRSEGKHRSLVDYFPRLHNTPVLSLTYDEVRTVERLVDYIEASRDINYGDYREDRENNILTLMRTELANIFSHHNLYVRNLSPEEQLVKRFSMLLAVGAVEHRDVDYFAGLFGMSPKLFASKVKRVTGKNPSEMIVDEVIKNAKHLMATTYLTSAEISERLNFATHSFFCRYFKRYVGVTPQEWREQTFDWHSHADYQEDLLKNTENLSEGAPELSEK